MECGMKLHFQIAKLAFAISLVVAGSTQVNAKETASLIEQSLPAASSKPLNEPIFAAPPLPPGTGAPGRRSDAGSRGCEMAGNPVASSQQRLVTALAPVYKSVDVNSGVDSEVVLGLTTAARPTFWFYIPYSSPSAYGEFVLKDEAEKLSVYSVALNQTPGIIGLTLSPTATSLEIGKRYRWYFNVYCQKDNELVRFVEGDIERLQLNPSLQNQLKQASLQQKVRLYAANGIWYDSITIAAELHRKSLNDSNWASLLRTVGLSEFAQEPIVSHTTLEKK
jgi:hypothetical protein